MWANDFRFSSHVSHFWTLLPIAKVAFSTLGLCQYTPSGVGTCPIIFVAIRFISAPLMPVSSALGTRVLVAMSPPGFCWLRHKDTGREPVVTSSVDFLDRRGEAGFRCHPGASPSPLETSSCGRLGRSRGEASMPQRGALPPARISRHPKSRHGSRTSWLGLRRTWQAPTPGLAPDEISSSGFPCVPPGFRALSPRGIAARFHDPSTNTSRSPISKAAYCGFSLPTHTPGLMFLHGQG